jgi:uncharacterized delta-60 repeat protein
MNTLDRVRFAARQLLMLNLSVFALLMASAPSSVFAQTPGDFDTSFGSGTGKIQGILIGPYSASVYAMAVQADGKIVLAGQCFSGLTTDFSLADFCVARLNADGTLDATFDGPSGNADGKFLLPIGTAEDSAQAMAIQDDGKIVLAGYCFSGSKLNFCVARLNVDGSLDASFDGPSGTGNGKFLMPIGLGNDSVRSIAIQADSKIVLVGICSNGSNDDFCMARLNTDGTLDASFDGPSGLGDGKFLLPIGSGNDAAYSVAMQADGKIVVVGTCHNGTKNNFCMARLNANGSLDETFVGTFSTARGAFWFGVGFFDDHARSLAIQPDGKIVLAGTCLGGTNNNFCIARLNANGTFDLSFGGPVGTANGAFQLPIGSGADLGNTLAIQTDGKIFIAGECYDGDRYKFCITRLHGDGSLDFTFDGSSSIGNGKFLFQVNSTNDNYANALAIQPDGKIVIAGRCGVSIPTVPGGAAEFCAARLNGGPFGARACTQDVDGDGVVLATTDLLIATRVALGIRGPSVLNGINLTGKPRDNWTKVRDYLFMQCGMNVY